MGVRFITSINERRYNVEFKVFADKIQLGEAAATQAAGAICRAIAERGRARIIAATGASQFEFLGALIDHREIDWSKVEMFHLDEYIGIPISHPAAFESTCSRG
jgi:glucosamine-6-phosphate deaminase